MSANISKLRQHESLDDLLKKIPQSMQYILYSVNIKLTCIYATSRIIAFGTNVGCIYIYERDKQEIRKLFCEDTTDIVSCVFVRESIETLIASGTRAGIIYIYQINDIMDESIKWVIDKTHEAPVTQLFLSQNNEQVFTGDESGMILCTKMIFNSVETKSFIISKENCAIVQLDYLHRNNIILVSTMKRSFIILLDKQNEIIQIGTKERKNLEKFGACFFFKDDFTNLTIFAVRPGLRLWQSDINGIVKQTFLFKNEFNAAKFQKLELIDEVNDLKYIENDEIRFGKILKFQENYLICWTKFLFFILDISGCIIYCNNNIGFIIDVCVNGDEIFVLRDKRQQVIRIAFEFDKRFIINNEVLNDYNNLELNVRADKLKSVILTSKNVLKKIVRDVSYANNFNEKSKEVLTLKNPSSITNQTENNMYTEDIRLSSVSRFNNVNMENINENIVHERKSGKKRKPFSITNSGSKIISDYIDTNIVKETKPLDCDVDNTFSDSIIEFQEINVLSNKTDKCFYIEDESKSKKINELSNDSDCLNTSSVNPIIEKESVDFEKLTNSLSAINTNKFFEEEIIENNFEKQSEIKNDDDITIMDTDIKALVNNDDLTKTNCDITENVSCELFYDLSSTEEVNDLVEVSIYEKTYDDYAFQKNNYNLHETEFDSDLVDISVSAIDVLPIQHLSEDIWSDIKLPSTAKNIIVGHKHFWIIDKNQKLYYCDMETSELIWKHVQDAPADKISVNISGTIFWRLYNNNVFVAQYITKKYPAGLKWVPILKDVIDISVSSHSAWYIKRDGSLMVQTQLSVMRPAYKSYLVPNFQIQVTKVSSFENVIWVIDSNGKIYTSSYRPNDDLNLISFTKFLGINSSTIIYDICLCSLGVAWLCDTSGSVWFTPNVSFDKPNGDGNIYQISLSSPIYTDKLSTNSDWFQFVSWNRNENVKLVASSERTTFVTETDSRKLGICKENIIGHRWIFVSLRGMANSLEWSLISASYASSKCGILFAMQACAKLFAIMPETLRSLQLECSFGGINFVPKVMCCVNCNLWVLSTDGIIYSRIGISKRFPDGFQWKIVDIMLTGSNSIQSCAINDQYGWCVDAKGQIFFRMSIKVPNAKSLSPAWLPIEESSTRDKNSIFVKIFCGYNTYMVWAIDSNSCVYVRSGITESLPIGNDWIYIPGLKAIDLSISSNAVYALTKNQCLFVRYNISENNVFGDYWKQIPFSFSQISVSQDNTLWAITSDGRLSRRMTHFLRDVTCNNQDSNQNEPDDLDLKNSNFDIEDWEIIN